ncbi:MAG: hypothetical protein R3Y56_03895 [Akkermansia sp.]
MKRTSLLLGAAACGLSLCACTNTNTPAYRIAKNPQVYDNLSPKDQHLVSQGRITTGMSPKAVFLAWGYPSNPPFKGEQNGQQITRWDYTRMQAVISINSWNGPDWGPNGWYDPAYQSPFDTSTTFVPKTTATVNFKDGRVSSWEAESHPLQSPQTTKE